MAEPSPDLLETVKSWLQAVAVPFVPLFTLLTVWFTPFGRGLRDRFSTSSAERTAIIAREQADADRREDANKLAFTNLKSDLAQARADIAAKDDELDAFRKVLADERRSGNRWYQIAFAWFSYYMERRLVVLQAINEVNNGLKSKGLSPIEYACSDPPEFERILELKSGPPNRKTEWPEPQ